MDKIKDKLMLDGKVYVTDEDLEDVGKMLEEKDIPFFIFPLFPGKTMIELDIKLIIKQLFEKE